LKGDTPNTDADDSVFQFHFGTIERVVANMKKSLDDLFQFHFGTIESSRPGQQQRTFTYFNSTLVRLKDLKGLDKVTFKFRISIPLWYD